MVYTKTVTASFTTRVHALAFVLISDLHFTTQSNTNEAYTRQRNFAVLVLRILIIFSPSPLQDVLTSKTLGFVKNL